MKRILILLSVIWCITTISEAATYNNSLNSGISEYFISEDYIEVKFKTGDKLYRYSTDVYTEANIYKLKTLAIAGKGLNSHINTLRKQDKEKIQKTPSAVFCGERGGYPENSFKFEISTRGKARATLSYAHWAKYPDGIQECVCDHYPDFPSCPKIRLEQINNLCGDIWCGNPYEYSFSSLIKTGENKWKLTYTTIRTATVMGEKVDIVKHFNNTCILDTDLKFNVHISDSVVEQISDCMDKAEKATNWENDKHLIIMQDRWDF